MGSNTWPWSVFCRLPRRIENDKIAWRIVKYDGQATGTDYLYLMDAVAWIELIAIFLEEWTNSDWIPTFDMVLIDEERGPQADNYRGNISIAGQ